MPDTPSPSTWNAAVVPGVAWGTRERRVLFPPPRSSAGTQASIACPSFLAAPALVLCKIWGAGVDHPRAGAWCVKPPCVLGPRGIGEHRSGQAKPLLGGGGAGPSSSSTKPWRGEFEVGVKSRDGQRSPKNNISPLPLWPVPLSPTEQTWPLLGVFHSSFLPPTSHKPVRGAKEGLAPFHRWGN